MIQQTQEPEVRNEHPAVETNTGAMLYLHALSPVHAGTGQAADVIDLPIAREQITNWPQIPGSTIKGVLRGASEDAAKNDPAATKMVNFAYGPKDSSSAGAVWFADARLLCLPVRSLAGTFAWVTCPMVLQRWLRDYRGVGQDLGLKIPVLKESEIALPVGGDVLQTADAKVQRVILEEIDLTPVTSEYVDAIAAKIADTCFRTDPSWKPVFTKRFGIVPDDIFTFLSETATEVTARISLDQKTKTVNEGGLWYEETLPPESILTCPVVISLQGARMVAAGGALQPARDSLLRAVGDGLKQPIQVGGDASIGHGMMQANLDPAPQA